MNESFGKKRVFVGSSTEGKQIAKIVIDRLQAHNLSTLAWYDFFQNKRPPLQELELLTLQADAAVLVATPDDQVIIRNRHWQQARDNVLFEYGLFSGAIGRAKCGLLVPDVEKFRIPSDFLGVACLQYFQVDAPSSAIELLAQSLATTIDKPPRPEDIMSRGRRLLRLLGWIRDESFRLVRDWDTTGGRALVADRLIAVSGFVQGDIDSLGLRKEYDDIHRLLLTAVDAFPRQIGKTVNLRPGRREMEDMVRNLVDGVRPNEEMFNALLHTLEIETRSRPSEWIENCPRGREHWPYWGEDMWRHRWYHDDPHYRHSGRGPLCGPFAWAAGAAEATAVFERYVEGTAAAVNPLQPLKSWSDKHLPMLNDAIVKFERRLHEELFGSL
jgi:Predicted nucleotide-binding protein containing TIR-like domain